MDALTEAEKADLYDALVRLCQDTGFTTAATYDHLHEAVDSILVSDEDDEDEDEDGETYEIFRSYSPAHEGHPDDGKIVATGLTLAEAQAHCQDPTSRDPGVYFEGYRKE